MIMALLILLAGGATCNPTPITLDEAKELVLHVPLAKRSVRERHAQLAAEIEQAEPNGWLLRVYATNSKSPSSLIGYYSVNRRTAEIEDFSLDGIRVTSQHLRKEQKKLLAKHCQISN
jgi:hypothetical protein